MDKKSWALESTSVRHFASLRHPVLFFSYCLTGIRRSTRLLYQYRQEVGQ